MPIQKVNPTDITNVSNTSISGTITGSQISANTVTSTNLQTGSVENYMSSQGTSFGMRNKIINGAMLIDQRNAGVSVTVSTDSIYCVDRFAGYKSGSVNNFTLQQSSTAPSGFSKSLIATMGTGVTVGSTDYAMLGQTIEGSNITDLNLGSANASAFVISFWVRCSVAGTFGVAIRNGTAQATYCATYVINSTNTWEYKTIKIPPITSGTWAIDSGNGFNVFWDLGVGATYSGTAGQLNTGSNYFGVSGTTKLAATTGATLYLTGVQVEKGTTATPFENRLISTELSLCQRYYEISNGLSQVSAGAAGFSTNTYWSGIQFAVTKRSTPTMTFYDTGGTINQITMWKSAASFVGSSLTCEVLTPSSFGLRGSNASVTDCGLGRFSWIANSEI